VDNNLREDIPFFAALARRTIKAMMMKLIIVVEMGVFCNFFCFLGMVQPSPGTDSAAELRGE
jgi:hypothetical protein